MTAQERKEARRAYMREYRASRTPEEIEARRATQRRYMREYSVTPKGRAALKAAQRKYRDSLKGREDRKRYLSTVIQGEGSDAG